MMREKNHIGMLLGALALLLVLMTGCAKDELMPPAGEQEAIMKSADHHDTDKPRIESATKDSDDIDSDDGITDDEDDEDDEDRLENR